MSMKDVKKQMTAVLKEAREVTGNKTLRSSDLYEVSPNSLQIGAGYVGVYLPKLGVNVSIKSSAIR